jgi:transketolase
MGKAKVHGDGSDVAIVACGIEVAQALLAQAQLEEEGIAARVLDMHTLKPLDEEAVATAARACGAVVTAEEHLLDGGLGARVSAAVGKHCPVPMEFIGVNDTYAESATPDQLLEKYGLTAPHIVKAVKRVLARK